MKFVLRSSAVQAVQWFPGKRLRGIKLIGQYGETPLYLVSVDGLNFAMEAGDWIIKKNDRSRFVMLREAFEKEYIPSRSGHK